MTSLVAPTLVHNSLVHDSGSRRSSSTTQISGSRRSLSTTKISGSISRLPFDLALVPSWFSGFDSGSLTSVGRLWFVVYHLWSSFEDSRGFIIVVWLVSLVLDFSVPRVCIDSVWLVRD
ncbi:hypothetical protein U1Q18_052511 [Sarracenia purpurea var. burkii]